MAYAVELALVALLPVAFVVRIVLAIFAKSYRNMIRQRPILHVMWFLGAVAFVYVFFVIPHLMMRDARKRVAGSEYQERMPSGEEMQNKVLDTTSL